MRQGNKRTLFCQGVLTEYNSLLLALSESDTPTYTFYNTILMVYSQKYYSGFMFVNPDGQVRVYWYSPGGDYADIGNEQLVYGQLSWYLPA